MTDARERLDRANPRKFWGLDWVAAHWPDLVIVLALLGLFWCRHRFFEEVEFGGDAVQKWQFARQWSYGNDFSHATWTHHMARMGVNALSWVVQKIFGRGWRAYYVAPFFMAALQVPLVYLLAKRLGGRLGGLLAVLSITFLAMVHRSASQLLPDGYAGTWAIGACYLYVRLLDASEAYKQRWLIALGVASFFGYLNKETFVFFYPGLAIAVWLVRRSWRDVALFAAILLLGLVLETAAYSLLTDYSGRWAIVRGTHLVDADEAEPVGMAFADLFQRFDELHNATKYLLFFALASALWHAVLRKDEQPQAKGVVLIGLSHVLFLTFLVRSIRPLDVFQGFDPRYMEPATPFLGVYAGSFLALVLRETWQPQAGKIRLLDRYGPGAGPTTQVAWALLVVGLLTYVTLSQQRRHPPLDAFARGAEIARLMNRTYDRNLPIVEHSSRAKILTAIYDVYMDDRRLARDGKLPLLDEVALKQRGKTYLIKDQAAYAKGTLSRLIKEGCFVAVKKGPARNPRTRDRRSTIGIEAPDGGPPASCDALLAEATRRDRP